jgi:hypothetical protein
MARTHSFSIVVSGLDTEADDFADRFFKAGCDDATVAVQKGLIVLDFDREAASLSSALVSAVVEVEEAGAKIERIEPDYLVNASDIAHRVGLGRAAISNYALGLRGRDFPHPVARVTTDSPLWDWVEVSSWMYARRKCKRAAVVEARALREVNRVIVENRRPAYNIGRRLERARAGQFAQAHAVQPEVGVL